MHGLPKYDEGRAIEWGKTSSDYGKHRPGPPPSFYARLQALGVGLPGQRILDLGTGTGLLAREFAKQGVIASGTDIATGQIEEATRLAAQQGLSCEFTVASSETQPFPDQSFDCISAMQCWLYFDQEKTVKEVKRLLKPGGVLMISHFSWLPRLDAVARASEQLVLKFNPQWGGKDWHGAIPPVCYELDRHFPLQAMFWYDEPIPFTRESWRGRMRACRGTGASLSPPELEQFDRAHEQMLAAMVPEEFTVLHRIDAHIFLNE